MPGFLRAALRHEAYRINPVTTPPTTPKHEDCPKKDEPKEDSDKDILSESTLMDTSPCDVVLQRLSPMNKASWPGRAHRKSKLPTHLKSLP